MRMSIAEADHPVGPVHRENLEALQDARFVNVQDSRPDIAKRHIIGRLKPYYLQSRMLGFIAWWKNENFDKKDFDGCMREVSK